jgi:hypothetical protein
MACLFKQHFVASLLIPKFWSATGSKFRSGTDEKFRGPTDRFHGLIQIPYASRGESLLPEQQARVLFVVPVVAAPLLITVTGWWIWRYRRTRV